MKQNKSTEDAVNMLNELFQLDPYAISTLINNRVVCTPELAHHPTCQVGMNKYGDCQVGMLGILNAIFGVNENGSGYIAAKYNDENELIGFMELK